MKIIDAHLHVWDIRQFQYPWLNDLAVLNKTFGVSDYKKAIEGYDIEAMVFVQCECLPEQSLKELDFVAEQKIADDRICAIVAYAALEKGLMIEPFLQQLKLKPLVKGVRRMTGEEPGLSISNHFIDAMKLLVKYELSLDLSIKPYQADETMELICKCPENKFILDHLGKPAIAKNDFEAFKKNITRFASFPNVMAKISGLITEADWKTWRTENIKPYINYTIEQFGFDRLLFGGDWPVVLLAGSFTQWMDTIMESTREYPENELTKLFYGNAKNVYGIL